MGQQQTGRFTTKEEEEHFNKMEKFDIYLAYLAEYKERKRLSKEVNRLHERMARARQLVG